MTRRTARAAAVVAAVGATTLLAGCVTNAEGGNPDGWTPIVPEEVPEIAALVPDEVAADGVLSVGTNPPFAPFEFKDSEGEIIGVEMDLAAAMAGVMGLDFQPVEQDFAMILPALQSGTVDMGVSGFTDTEERREGFDFVNYLYAGIQWAQQTGDEINPADPCGLTVSVQRTTVSETDDVRPKAEACEESGQEAITVLSYDTSDNAALATLIGRADAFSADSPVTSWAVNRSDGELELIGDIFDAAPYGFAVNKGSELGPAAAAALQHLIETGEYAEILAQWSIEDGLVETALINEQPVEGVSQ